ncbi:MAG: hypothetical protein M3176_00635, partial [Chloroflexota bacterium]|nr:hypothetical protein [Chloroflexota bacterium]
MASIVLIAAFVGVYAGIFLASVYMVSVAERAHYPVAVSVARPVRKRQSAPRPAPAIAAGIKSCAFVPN